MIGGFELAIERMRPREGWLPVLPLLLLLITIEFCVVAAVLEAGWVPEADVVVWATVGGILLGTVLAVRRLSALVAWLFITLYGFLVLLIHLANLWPPWAVLLEGWEGLRQFWLQSGALFFDRVGSWFTAVFNGQSSQETIVFALGLGILGYFLAAFTSWQLFRHDRPLPGLVSMGLALALNGYFGGVPLGWMGAFVGLAAVLTAVTHIITLQKGWEAKQVDYSSEMQIDLFIHAAIIATILIAVAVTLPSINIRQWVTNFQQQPMVQQTEALLERVFAGVDSGRGRQPTGRDGVGGSGILPREYLLGNAPELYETVVMTAVVQSEANLAGVHWRALSYDVYTGRGWALSEERREPIGANSIIDQPVVEATGTVSQTVSWVQDGRLIRYSLGLPQQFNQDADVIWRGQTDFVRVQGRGSSYRVQSQISLATPTMLRETAVADVPPLILARYTALPDSIPQRVLDLAQEVVGSGEDGQTNPYDQARAIELFLRQYEYSLEIDSPPRNADPVDYFLFEQQMGYCDSYASAMVVMARAVGLPARLGIGYLPQPTEPGGEQIIRQINGHSWAEIYFAGFGWVEFEPTAVFVSSHDISSQAALSQGAAEEAQPSFDETVPPPLPDVVADQSFPWLQLFAFGVVATFIAWLWRRNQLPVGGDAVVWSYGRLQQQGSRLGNPPIASQTPREYLLAFQNYLQQYGRFPRLAKRLAQLQPHLSQLTQLYVQRIYAGDEQSGRILAWKSWQKVRRPLWLLRVVNWLVKVKGRILRSKK